MGDINTQHGYEEMLARCRQVDRVMSAHPELIEKYNELLDAALAELSQFAWVEEVLSKVDCGYMPQYSPQGLSDADTFWLCGYYAAADERHGHFIVHCLVHNDKLWWLKVLCHELRHLWQRVIGELDLTTEDDKEYRQRSYEQDAIEQSSLVTNLDPVVIQRLDAAALQLETALQQGLAEVSVES